MYEQLGNSKTTPVTTKVVQAFLLPLVIFVTTVAISQRLLSTAKVYEVIKTLSSVLLAVVAVGVYIVVLKLLRGENRN